VSGSGSSSTAARRQFADQREHVVAILFMGAGQEGETAIVLDDAVVILGKAELRQRVVERATRRDEECRDMQASTALRRILLRHNCSSQEADRQASLSRRCFAAAR
jgi:hypothetical protein